MIIKIENGKTKPFVVTVVNNTDHSEVIFEREYYCFEHAFSVAKTHTKHHNGSLVINTVLSVEDIEWSAS